MRMFGKWGVLPLVAVVSPSACTTIPTGPSVMILPGTGKPFEEVQADDAVCRQWAQQQAGTKPEDAAVSATSPTLRPGDRRLSGMAPSISSLSGCPATPPSQGSDEITESFQDKAR